MGVTELQIVLAKIIIEFKAPIIAFIIGRLIRNRRRGGRNY